MNTLRNMLKFIRKLGNILNEIATKYQELKSLEITKQGFFGRCA